MRARFFGFCTVGLGAWELASTTGRVPTITAVLHRRPRLRFVWVVGLVAVGRHLWGER